MSAPNRTPSLRENTRRDVGAMLATSPHRDPDPALLDWIANAVEYRSPGDLKAVVLGVLDARNDARVATP